MRKEKALISLLRGLVELLAKESAHNPEFGSKIEELLSNLPERKTDPKRISEKKPLREELPDIYTEWDIRGETDFRLWLREQQIPVLRAIIRAQDFDTTRRSTKWKETAKLADFIADCLRTRLSRGSAFIGKGTVEQLQ